MSRKHLFFAHLAIAPRFVVQNLEQALAFYGQLGFQTTYYDEGFAIVERDGLCFITSPSIVL